MESMRAKKGEQKYTEQKEQYQAVTKKNNRKQHYKTIHKPMPFQESWGVGNFKHVS